MKLQSKKGLFNYTFMNINPSNNRIIIKLDLSTNKSPNKQQDNTSSPKEILEIIKTKSQFQLSIGVKPKV